jgi:histidine ammonia-lyase
MKQVVIDGQSLNIEQIKAVAREYAEVVIDKAACAKSEKSYAVLQKKIDEKVKIYGVTTGFGEFSQVFIEPDKAAQLQMNLVRSHSTGVGDPAKEEMVRATMLSRANYLASGLSGARPVILQTLVAMLNKRVTPLILEQGSVGSSGDLAPLAMMSLPIIGEGEAFFGGKRMSGKKPCSWPESLLFPYKQRRVWH